MGLAFFKRALTVVRGGGDLASGVIYRLHHAGFPIIVTELASPKLVRRTVSFGEAIYSQLVTVENVTAQCADSIEACYALIERGIIPIIVDESKAIIQTVKPIIVVDARMEKQSLDTIINDAPLVIALGPGYTAGVNCHVVIETNRGHNLGRVIRDGSAEPDTGAPGKIQGQTYSRVLRAPADGHVDSHVKIGDTIVAGQHIAIVNGKPVIAPFDGVLRGLAHSSLKVTIDMKIGDLDPRIESEHCYTISDKSLAVGGGVLEAVFSAQQVRAYLREDT
jgi:xanthine dehydrogenase accessory factor